MLAYKLGHTFCVNFIYNHVHVHNYIGDSEYVRLCINIVQLKEKSNVVSQLQEKVSLHSKVVSELEESLRIMSVSHSRELQLLEDKVLSLEKERKQLTTQVS